MSTDLNTAPLTPSDHKSTAITISKYKKTAHWAVYINDSLLVVAVYKKGALAVKEALLAAFGRVDET